MYPIFIACAIASALMFFLFFILPNLDQILATKNGTAAASESAGRVQVTEAQSAAGQVGAPSSP